MSFKIGDKVSIHDSSWSILIKGTEYDPNGVYGIDKIIGVIKAVNCRLPIGRDRWGNIPSPIGGMSLHTGGVMFHDLLVQTKDGFVFTSTRHVKLVPTKPKKYFVCVLGVKVEVTKSQYNAVEASENTANDCYTGTFDEEDWE